MRWRYSWTHTCPLLICLAGSSGGTREATLAILEIGQRAERIAVCRELTGIRLREHFEPPGWDLGEIGAMHACGQVEAWHPLGIRPLGSALCSAGDGDTKNTELSLAPGRALLCVLTVSFLPWEYQLALSTRSALRKPSPDPPEKGCRDARSDGGFQEGNNFFS